MRIKSVGRWPSVRLTGSYFHYQDDQRLTAPLLPGGAVYYTNDILSVDVIVRMSLYAGGHWRSVHGNVGGPFLHAVLLRHLFEEDMKALRLYGEAPGILILEAPPTTYVQQLIEAPPTDQPRLAAVFEYGDRKIRLLLRPKHQERIRQCIRSAVKAHENLSSAYFGEIELFSYHGWATFDRRKIFAAEGTSLPESERSGTKTGDIKRSCSILPGRS